MKKISYFWPRTFVQITFIVFISQVIVDVSGIANRKQGFEWVTVACGLVFFSALLFVVVAILFNAWIEWRGKNG